MSDNNNNHHHHNNNNHYYIHEDFEKCSTIRKQRYVYVNHIMDMAKKTLLSSSSSIVMTNNNIKQQQQQQEQSKGNDHHGTTSNNDNNILIVDEENTNDNDNGGAGVYSPPSNGTDDDVASGVDVGRQRLRRRQRQLRRGIRRLYTTEIQTLHVVCNCRFQHDDNTTTAADVAPPPKHDHSTPSSSFSSSSSAIQSNHGTTTSTSTTTTCNTSSSNTTMLFLLAPLDTISMDHSYLLRRYISNTTFQDMNVLVFEQQQYKKEDIYYKHDDHPEHGSSSSSRMLLFNYIPTGIHSNTLIRRCILHVNNTRIRNNTILSDTYIGSNSIVMNCGTLHVSSNDINNNNNINNNEGGGGGGGGGLPKRPQAELLGSLKLSVGPEGGGDGRPLHVQLESTIIDVSRQITNTNTTSRRTQQQQQQDNNNDNNDNHHPHHLLLMNIIDEFVVICDTPIIDTIYMYPTSSIQNATCIKQCILCNHSQIIKSSNVINTMLQWNVIIETTSSVQNTLCMEQCHIGPNSYISSCVLGPDVHVSNGEIYNSILGPNIASHHQSLLISILWFSGRGNVGYGANVGSNHTGRIADQEAVIGEGIFWGLSTCIKYPINLLRAPYTIIAAGTTVAPHQIITMPFSLIITRSRKDDGTTSTSTSSSNSHKNQKMNHHHHHHYNRNNIILPGWILLSSPYTIERSIRKYASRRKAIRHLSYTGWDILFRPQIIRLCIYARQQLLSILYNETADATALEQQKQQKQQKQKVQNKNDSTASSSSASSSSSSGTSSSCYTSDDIYGIGSDQILYERGRQNGIRAYTDLIQRYALRGLLQFVHDISSSSSTSTTTTTTTTTTKEVAAEDVDIESILRKEFGGNAIDDPSSSSMLLRSTSSSSSASPPLPTWDDVLPWDDETMNIKNNNKQQEEWKFQRMILMNEFPIDNNNNNTNGSSSSSSSGSNTTTTTTTMLIINWMKDLLENQLCSLEYKYYNLVYQSKKRDDDRGTQTIPGYDTCHTFVTDDDIIRNVHNITKQIELDVTTAIEKLQQQLQVKHHVVMNNNNNNSKTTQTSTLLFTKDDNDDDDDDDNEEQAAPPITTTTTLIDEEKEKDQQQDQQQQQQQQDEIITITPPTKSNL